MKTSKIGELNFSKFKTEIYTTEAVKQIFKKEKISLVLLIPTPWAWYNSELLEATDENGDGKIDERFGKSFKIIYLTEDESIKEFEKDSLLTEKTTIKNIHLKYITLKA